MSKIQEFKELFRHIHSAWQQNEKAVLVILTDVRGSAYRLPGSKMLMTSSGNMIGTVSGGCLEADLYCFAEKVFETNKPLLHQYDLSDTEIWSLGIGCKGDLQFLFLPISSENVKWRKIQQLLQQDQGFSLVINMQTGELAVITEQENVDDVSTSVPIDVIKEAQKISIGQTRAQVLSYENVPYLIDTIKQSEHVIVAGAGQDALPVVELAQQAGFSVTVLDSRAHFNNEQRFPYAIHITTDIEELSHETFSNSWWVIMNHHQQTDEQALRFAIETQPKYIGVLGPTYRTNEMLQHIGYDISSGPIYSPIGLDIGAETMHEVAISIISEMMSLRVGRPAQSLHGKPKIHV